MYDYNHIYNKLKERVDLNLLPGFSVSISENGKEVYRTHLNYKGNEIFRLASMTKPVTAVAALIAEELGLINIDDKISKYIDGFDKMKIGKMDGDIPTFLEYASKIITIKDILRHQSGIGSDVVGYYQCDHRKAPETLSEAVNDYKDWYLDFEPGSKALYSGTTALDIVAYIIEITSKMPYEEFLKKYLFTPLNMVDTTYKLNDEQKNRLAPMYNMIKENGEKKMIYSPFDSYTGFEGFVEGFPCGAAGLMSSLEDYTHFSMMLAGKGIYNGVRVLKEESVIKMCTDIIPLPCQGVDSIVNWGYAVYVRGDKASFQPLKRGTFGWSGAYSPHFFVNIKDNTSVVMMTNLNNDEGSGSPNIKVLEKAYSEIINQED